ncbi:MAG: hypothetical protein AAF485_00360 [Chloroflexota bacterium]
MQKTLDRKLNGIRTNPDSQEFIICYAADPDMGGGINPIVDTHTSLQAYHDDLVAIVEQAKLDILLTSTSTMDVLARDKRLFDQSPVTPAIRANDTTDVWHIRGNNYTNQLSRPFATTTIEEAQYGTLLPNPGRQPDVNLGLYSLTFNNDLDTDLDSLEQFKAFRIEAVKKGFRYFVEVFNPNAPVNLTPEQIPDFVNDCISRMLVGIPRDSAPEFLKIPYNGPRAIEELVTYTSAIVGVLGGSPSTTYDAFLLLANAKKYGARVALFGRRIKLSEDPLTFTAFLRDIADGNIDPEEAVKAYRGALQAQGINPQRSLEDDMIIHTPALKR